MAKQIPELLAPAGSMDALKAAVNAGADAVYLAGKQFSARHYAANFDDEELNEAVNFAHLREVKIYVTVNTLIKDQELK
jgi:putative protease